MVFQPSCLLSELAGTFTRLVGSQSPDTNLGAVDEVKAPSFSSSPKMKDETTDNMVLPATCLLLLFLSLSRACLE